MNDDVETICGTDPRDNTDTPSADDAADIDGDGLPGCVDTDPDGDGLDTEVELEFSGGPAAPWLLVFCTKVALAMRRRTQKTT